MLRVLPRTFKPVNNLICCKTGLMWVVKRTTSLYNSFSSSVARQVARFSVPKVREYWFTLEEIFAGKMFAVIFICGNLLLRIAGKIAKIRTRKNFVPHGISSSETRN